MLQFRSITLCRQLKYACAAYCSVQNSNIPNRSSKLIQIFVKQNHISEFDIPVLQTMNLKRPLKLSARCCQTGAKIFLAQFIRASNSIPVGKNFLCSSLEKNNTRLDMRGNGQRPAPSILLYSAVLS